MTRHSRWVWITVLGLGWLLDFLFWKQALGINFAIYTGMCLIAGFCLLRLDGVRPASRSLWLLPPIVLFAVSSFVRAEPLSTMLAIGLALALMVVLAITFAGGRWFEYGLPDYALGVLRLAWSIVTKPIAFRAPASTEDAGGRPAAGAWPIVRGVLLALPILVLFSMLLGSADPVFRKQLDDLIKLLSLERLPEYMFRLTYILVAALALLGVYLHSARESRDGRLIGRERSLGERPLGFTEASIVLSAVTLLFLAFVIVQFRYFFGGQANINVQGFTYAEYARRGYGELLAVAFFSLLMILALDALTRRDSVVKQRLFSGLSVLVVALVGVMLVSAYMRLALYEAAYGFSRLRTYVHVSLVWLGLLLVAVVALELLRRERQIVTVALMGSMGFALTLTALNVDAFIVRQNVARALQGAELDVPHLASLSTDAIPPLVEFFVDASAPDPTRQQIGAALACHLQARSRRPASDGRSFTVSGWQAERSLEAIRVALKDYRLVQEEWMIRIVTPQGDSYDCYVHWD